jgi:hypothetical protein
MTFRQCIFGMMSLCFTASSVLAEEVLYCTDTSLTGFVWKNGAISTTNFNPEHFTIKVLSDTKRVVGEKVGSYLLTCEATDPTTMLTGEGAIACKDFLGSQPWMFYRKGASNTYTRAFLNGPPAGGGDPNINVAYGVCTKF